MAIVVEDGTGLPNANSYVSVAEASAFLTMRALNAFTGLADDAAREAALVNATDWLTSAYDWHGVRKLDTQALAWPRYGRTRRLPAGVPPQIVRATSRVAEAIAAGAKPFKTVTPRDLVRRVQAGSVSVEFSDDAIAAAANGGLTMPFLNDLLAGLYDVAPDGARTDGFSTMAVARR